MNSTKRKPHAKSRPALIRAGRLALATAVSLGSLIAATVHAQTDIYVLRVGDGSAINSDYKPFTIMQFSDDGTVVNSWDAPSVDPGDRITIGASFTTYAHLNRSLDGNYLTFAGRDVAVGGGTAAAQNIVIGAFSLQTNTFDTTTRLPQSAGNGYRAAVTVDGSEYWISGQGGGVLYAKHGQTTPSTSILTTAAGGPSAAETAGIRIINNRIFFSRRAGSDRGIQYMDPEGLHRTHGNERVNIEGDGWRRTSENTPSSYNSFEFLDENTLFLTNSNSLQVYYRSDSTAGEFDGFNLLTGANQGLSDLSGESFLSLLEQNGEVYLYYTSGMGKSDNGLYSVLWDRELQVFGTPNLIATAGEGYTFGGLVAIPEPSTYALLFGSIGLVVAFAIRRRRR